MTEKELKQQEELWLKLRQEYLDSFKKGDEHQIRFLGRMVYHWGRWDERHRDTDLHIQNDILEYKKKHRNVKWTNKVIWEVKLSREDRKRFLSRSR